MTIKAVRVSKASFKSWVLHGPVDQALKTSTQAEAIKAIPIHIDDIHGKPVDVELWINTQEAVLDGSDEVNPPAQVIWEQNELRKRGLFVEDVLNPGKSPLYTPPIKGVAILTGEGCTDFPEDNIECTLAALVGQHEQVDHDAD